MEAGLRTTSGRLRNWWRCSVRIQLAMQYGHGDGAKLTKVREQLAAHGYQREPFDVPKHHNVERYRKAGGIGITVNLNSWS
jgi:hypothetical protein